MVYEYGNIDFPAKGVSYHHKCRLQFTYQVSKSKSHDTAILDDAYTNTFSYIQTYVIDESQPESIIISLQGKFQNFCTDRDIGNIDDISTQQTLFSKIQENFGDWIKTFYYSKKWLLCYLKLVWIKKRCHLFFKAIWRLLLLLIAPYCWKQLGLSASCCRLWKALGPVSLLCVAASSCGADAPFGFLFWYTTPIQSTSSSGVS